MYRQVRTLHGSSATTCCCKRCKDTASVWTLATFLKVRREAGIYTGEREREGERGGYSICLDPRDIPKGTEGGRDIQGREKGKEREGDTASVWTLATFLKVRREEEIYRGERKGRRERGTQHLSGPSRHS